MTGGYSDGVMWVSDILISRLILVLVLALVRFNGLIVVFILIQF